MRARTRVAPRISRLARHTSGQPPHSTTPPVTGLGSAKPSPAPRRTTLFQAKRRHQEDLKIINQGRHGSKFSRRPGPGPGQAHHLAGARQRRYRPSFRSGPPKQMLVQIGSGMAMNSMNLPSAAITLMPPRTSEATQILPSRFHRQGIQRRCSRRGRPDDARRFHAAAAGG